ncbi:50S ribosomal protein L22 [Candidatus Woesearchaeota archaeon]|nr:50S ribosomal protein L22 [Candidatus Woesearchaeota archaeon]
MNPKNNTTTAVAVARALNVPVSSKQGIELSNYLRYHSTARAKIMLEEVIALRRAVPYRRFTKDLGHKPGIGAGRFPQKAAGFMLRLVKAVEANAQVKGLNSSSLKITKLVVNKASTPFSGGRLRHRHKRSHIEIEVQEGSAKIKADKSKSNKPTSEKKAAEGKKSDGTP